MKRVYIAGKLNADAVGYLKNVSAMIQMAIKIQRMGFSVFVPCLDLLVGIVDGGYEYEDYAGNNMCWLEVSDYVLVLPNSEDSTGTQKEITRAGELGIPIFYSPEALKDPGKRK